MENFSSVVGGIVGALIGTYLVLRISKNKNAKFFNPNKQNTSDKKFFVPYWELTYKGKFRRSIYVLVFAIAILPLLVWKNKSLSMFLIAVILGGVVQAIYTYIKWKQEK